MLQDKEEEELFIPHVSISRVERMASGNDSFVCYVIQVNDGAKNYTIFRRFKQFSDLHSALKKKYPEVVFPEFPSRTLWKKYSKEFIESRKSVLENYIKQIALSETIRNSEEFKTFLTASFEVILY